jgi:hypothetical protein
MQDFKKQMKNLQKFHVVTYTTNATLLINGTMTPYSAYCPFPPLYRQWTFNNIMQHWYFGINVFFTIVSFGNVLEGWPIQIPFASATLVGYNLFFGI